MVVVDEQVMPTVSAGDARDLSSFYHDVYNETIFLLTLPYTHSPNPPKP